MKERLWSILLSICIVLTGIPVNTYASDTVKTVGANLEIGKTYSVPIEKYGEDGKEIDWAARSYEGQDLVDSSALVTPNEDGTYQISLAWSRYQYFDAVQFMKPGTVEDGSSIENIKMGTYNIPDAFIINKTKINTAQGNRDFSDILRNEVLSERADSAQNDKYIESVSVTEPDSCGIQYISFQVDSLEHWLYYKYLATALYPIKNLKDATNEANHDTILEGCQYCFGGGAFSFDLTKAREVVGLEKYESDNTFWHVSRASNAFDDNSGDGFSRDYITEEVQNLLKKEVSVKNNGDSVDVSFSFADDVNIKEVYEVIGTRKPTEGSGASSVVRSHRLRVTTVYTGLEYDELNSLLSEDGKSFTLRFHSTLEAEFGKIIKVVLKDNTPYEFFIGASATDNTVTFRSDNMSFTTEKDNIDETGVFESNPLTEGEDYENFSAILAGHCSKYLIYEPTFKVGDKKRNPKNNVDIKMTLPEDWNPSKFVMYYFTGTSSEGSLTEIGTNGGSYSYSLDGHNLTFTTKNLNNTYIIAEKGEAASAEELKSLADGLYSVDIVSWNKDQVGQLSMSNVAIDKDSSLLSVRDGVYTLYTKLQAIMISGKEGYAQRVFYTDDNGDLQEFNYYSWVTTEDGSSVYNTDYYGKTYGLYYPQAIGAQLSQTAINTGSFDVDFWVPAMDEVSGFVPGSGKAHRTAEFKFYNLEKLSDDIEMPTYEASYLLKSIEDAEVYTNASDEVKEMYDADCLAELNGKVISARTSYELLKQEGNGEVIFNYSTELEQATAEFLRISLNKMIDQASRYDSSEYTEESYQTMKTVLEEAVVVANSTSATNDEKNDALSKLYAGVLGLTKANTVDKTALLAKIDKAKEEAKKTEVYKPSSIETLQGVIDKAQEIADSDTALQEDIDAQITALEAAMENLEKQVNKDELLKKYDEAVKIYDIGNEQGKYTAKAWEAFEKAVLNAKEVLDNKDATESEVKAARTELFNTMNDLTVSVDKSALLALIQEAEEKDVSDCTNKSVEVLQKALNAAQAVAQAENPSQDAIDKQYNLLTKALAALVVKSDDSEIVYDGTYQIFGRLWQANRDIPENWKEDSAEGNSMGDAALNHEITMTVKDGKATLTLEFKQHKYTLMGESKTGYLKNLRYFPDYTGEVYPSGQTPVEVEVTGYWEDENGVRVSDDYGTDYPRYMKLPLNNLGQSVIWVQVFVPVMDSISSGTGTQGAKIVLDWDSRKQLTGIETNKNTLSSLITKAKGLEQGTASDETYAAVLAAVEFAEDVNTDLNVSQEVVDAAANLLQAAINAMDSAQVEVDKAELKSQLEKAKAIVESDDIIYTEATLDVLKTAYENGLNIYDRKDASQSEVNSAVMNLKNAIGDLIKVADKTKLKAAMENAAKVLEDTDSYTASAIDALEKIYAQAEEAYEDSNTSQATIDSFVSALNYMVKNMVKIENTVDKDALAKMLIVAANMAGRESIYTAESLDNLKAVIEAAQAVYDDKSATEEEVDEQVSLLTTAIVKLERDTSSNNGGNGNNNGNNNNNNNNGGNNNTLDINNLPDGVYSLTGNMVKVDKETASMSDAAINHTVKLTVKDGKYYITLNFEGLTVGQRLGYLSQLKYFTTGYTLDKYGNPQGTLADVTIDSYQKNSDGSLVSDTYGTDYPDEVTFELIPEALKDGYVPLQVYVPIMESISAGTGTQPVFLKLDWSTLKETTSDDPDFNNSANNNNNNNGGTTNTNGGTTGTLGTNTLGSSSLTSGTGSSLSSGSGTSGTSSLKSGTTGSSLSSGSTASSLKSGTGSSLSSGSTTSGTSSLKSGTSGTGSSLQSASSVKTGDEIQNNALWAAILLLGGVLLMAGVMEYKKTIRKVKK